MGLAGSQPHPIHLHCSAELSSFDNFQRPTARSKDFSKGCMHFQVHARGQEDPVVAGRKWTQLDPLGGSKHKVFLLEGSPLSLVCSPPSVHFDHGLPWVVAELSRFLTRSGSLP